MNEESPAADPLAVHRDALIIDTHADTPQRMVDEGYDLAGPLNGGHFNFESAKEGNVGAEFFAIWVDPRTYQGEYARRALQLIDAVYQQAAGILAKCAWRSRRPIFWRLVASVSSPLC